MVPVAKVVKVVFAVLSPQLTVTLHGLPAGSMKLPRLKEFEDPSLAVWFDGRVTVGPLLSTMKVVLGPAASDWLPARSNPEPASMEIPSVPSPVMLLMVTVRMAPVLLSKLRVPVALPVALRCTLAADRVLDWKLASVYVSV